MILLLAPSCPICREGAAKVQKEILDKIDDPKLRIFVVWLPVFQAGSRDWAADSADLIPDKRATHLWDPDKKLGLRYGKILNLSARDGKKSPLAWDTYLLFGGDSKWKGSPPKPAEWMWRHPLGRKDGRFDAAKLLELVKDKLRPLYP